MTKKDVQVNLPMRMAMSAVAGMGGSTCCQPLDVIKFQMQMDNNRGATGGTRMYKNTLDCGVQIYQRGGVRTLYAGLSAAYLRQCMYGSGRMGIYSFLFNKYKTDNNGALPNLATKLAMGGTSGCIGAFIGNPADMALVRMSADSKKPLAERANYRGVGDCIKRIVAADGVPGLWKGVTVTMARAAVLSGCQMGMTSQTRQYIGEKKLLPPGAITMVCSTAIASVVACSASLPLDVIKNRFQNSSTGKYTGMIDCLVKSVRAEGPMILWRGLTPALIKLTPYTIISLTLLEKISYLVTGTNAM